MKKGKNIDDPEYLKYASYITDNEVMTLTDIIPKQTGIKDVVLWVGDNPHTKARRVKVSNMPNSLSRQDCFTLTMPEFEILGTPNRELINDDVMKDIIKFVQQNLQAIYDYSDFKISTDVFFDKIIRI